MGDKGFNSLETPDSQRGAPPNRGVREGWAVRCMALAGGSADPVSRRGACGVSPGLRRFCLFKIVPFLTSLLTPEC